MAYKYKKIKLKDNSIIDEHRLVWEQHNGVIPKEMVVHHKNNDPKDNRIENLELLSRSEHSKLHMTGKPNPHKKHGRKRYEAGCRCKICKAASAAKRRRQRSRKS